MNNKHKRSLVLCCATLLWLGLTGWVTLGKPVSGASDTSTVTRVRRDRGIAATQEPPPPLTLWEKFTSGARSLLLGSPANPARQAVLDAMQPTGALAWHQTGYQGKGIKVAILDSGFKNYRQATGKAIPASVQVCSFRKDGLLDARESQHGILCGEVVHHLAPQADMLLANWEPETPRAFLEAVRWARQQGAQIISCSMIMPNWSDGEGGGPIHRALRELLGTGDRPGDALFFASAGNTAQRHWGGELQPTRDGWHQWTRGKIDNAIRPYIQERLSVELTHGEGVYELLVLDSATGREVGRGLSQTSEPGCAAAVVRFEPDASKRYQVRLRRTDKGKSAGRFHLTVLGGKLQYARQQGSIPFPSDGAEVVAVAAVDARGRRQSYSSCGPLRQMSKPDLAAIVPFPSVWRPEQAFSGTSAAAPQAAGLAALLWSRHPDWTANQVRQALCQATRLKKPGHCVEIGHGIVAVPAVKQ